MVARLTPENYHAIASERGITWIGELPRDNKVKTLWLCSNGHEFWSAYNSVQRGHTCAYCSRTAPKTVADYHALARELSIYWIGNTLVSVATKTLWRCEFGHEWEANYNTLRGKRSGCPHCSGSIPKNADDYHALANKRGFVFVGDVPVNAHTKTQWICSKGHQVSVSYHSLRQQVYGCVLCSAPLVNASRTKQPRDYHELASERGFSWIGEYPKNSGTKTLWECPKGHQFMSRYNDMKKGSGCPYCSGNTPHTSANYHALATKHGLTWVGELPQSANHDTEWLCPQGHVFTMRYASIYIGHNCPHCSQHARKTIADYHAMATKRGFAWLGLKAVATKELTEWQCSKGHTFQATYQGMGRGNECPYCTNRVNGFPVSKPQLKIHAITGGILNYRGKRAKTYGIDIALDTDTLFPIAIEYDGAYWHTLHPEHDAKRDEWLLAHGWSILHIKSVKQLPAAQEIHAAIAQLRNGVRYLEIIMPDYKP